MLMDNLNFLVRMKNIKRKNKRKLLLKNPKSLSMSILNNNLKKLSKRRI